MERPSGPPDLFVSDLHLAAERPAMRHAFGRFLRIHAAQARALYILGDLFDYWIGDDDLDESFHADVAAELAATVHAGCLVYVLRGNRDFLLGERFAARAHATLLAEPTVIDQAGVRTLLLHGDTLCTDDRDYQVFRAMVRAEAWQREFTTKPLAERRELALKLRADSRASQRRKSDAVMDAVPAAVVDAFRRHDCTRMIHGHTHKPARHIHVVDGRACERWVLADWIASGSFLRCDSSGTCKSVPLPLTDADAEH